MIKKIFFFLFFLCYSKLVFAYVLVKPYNMQRFDAEINKMYQQKIINSAVSINNNIESVSAYFLGRPYVLSSMGEGPNGKYDQNPLYRTDEFDCQTYVMMVMALSRNTNLNDFKKDLLQINYRNNQALFQNRNHFTETQWDPNNIQKDTIRDITRVIYPDASIEKAASNVGVWFQKFSLYTDRLQLLKPINKRQQISLIDNLRHSVPSDYIFSNSITYIPSPLLLSPEGQSILRKIPSGSIVQFVTKLPYKTALFISPYVIPHVGFVIVKNQQLWLRNASMRDRKVEDILLTSYLVYHPNFIGVRLLVVQAIDTQNT